jgi:hypothetical protein
MLKHTNSVALSPQAKYTDWVTATCQRNLVPTNLILIQRLLDRKGIISTERPSHVDGLSVNFCG